MNKINLSMIVFLFILILVSFRCADPSCTHYLVNVVMNTVPNDVKELWVRDTTNGLFGAVLKKENGYSYLYINSRMGPQVDYRNPDGEIKEKLDRIMRGTVLNVDAEKYDGTIFKYTISYTNLNCVDTIGEGNLYHTIKITLDWKDVKPITNN